jgi:ferrous iron transport protein A
MKRIPISLIELPASEMGTVIEIQGGRGLVSRLATLGFTPGAQITMVQNYRRGPLIVRVRDTRIALGRGEALKIKVARRSEHGPTNN